MYKNKKLKFLLCLLFLLSKKIFFSANSLEKNNETAFPKLIIHASRLEIDQKTKIAIFSGKVEAHQKDFTLKSDCLKIYYNHLDNTSKKNPKIEKMEAYKNVTILRGTQVIEGESALFKSSTNSIVITGDNLNYKDGRNKVKACRIIFNRDNQKTILESCKSKNKGVVLEILP